MGEPQWAPDPWGHHQRRFHDGTTWTAAVQNGDVTGVDPVDVSAPPPPIEDLVLLRSLHPAAVPSGVAPVAPPTTPSVPPAAPPVAPPVPLATETTPFSPTASAPPHAGPAVQGNPGSAPPPPTDRLIPASAASEPVQRKPRRTRRVLAAAAGVIVLGIAAMAGYFLVSGARWVSSGDVAMVLSQQYGPGVTKVECPFLGMRKAGDWTTCAVTDAAGPHRVLVTFAAPANAGSSMSFTWQSADGTVP